MDPTAVVGRRVVAYIVDSLVVAAISFAAWYALTEKIPGRCVAGGVTIGGDCHGFVSGSSNRAVWLLICLATSFVVFALLPGLRGWSPGKALVGIRVIARDGGMPGVGRGIVRTLMLYFVDNFPYIIPMLVGFIAAVTDDQQHRRLGDRVAGTLVVRKDAVGEFSAQPAFAGVGAGYGAGTTAPGWYDDPQREARLRWWDGNAWTSHTQN
jgi:uncharacterized RDD family membrane protein YckC